MLVGWLATYDTKIVYYVTGTDVLVGDPLGKMEITEQVTNFLDPITLGRMCVCARVCVCMCVRVCVCVYTYTCICHPL